LIAQLYQGTEWKLVFTNGAEVWFTRSEKTSQPACDLGADATTDRLLREMSARFADDARLLEAARLQLASLQIAVGAFGQAQRSLAGASSPAALALSARAYVASGELERARALTERLLRMEPDDPRGLTVLAQLHAHNGRSAQAVASLGRALAADPFDREATRLLAAFEESQHGP
jgi:tetratricopeptide (TPR) repeat protein